MGAGLLWTVLRPAAVSGMLPVTAAFVAGLAAYSAGDLLNGTATAARVLSHGFLLLGLGLLVMIRLGRRDPGGRTPQTTSTSSWSRPLTRSSRARATLDRTVPTGHPQTSAASA